MVPAVRKRRVAQNHSVELLSANRLSVLGPRPWIFLGVALSTACAGYLFVGSNRLGVLVVVGAIALVGLAQLIWVTTMTRRLARSTVALETLTSALSECEDISRAAEAGLRAARTLVREPIKVGISVNVGGATVSMGEPLGGVQSIIGDENVHLTITGTPTAYEAWCCDQIVTFISLAMTSVQQRTDRYRVGANWKALSGANSEIGLILDSNERIVKASSNAKLIFGEELIGQRISNLLPVGVLAFSDDLFQDPNDVHRWIRVRYQQAPNQSFIATLTDATEELRAQRIDVDTGLPNLTDFAHIQNIEHSTLLMIGADHYSRVLHAAGVDAAHRVLSILGVRIQEHFRAGIDLIWRGPGPTFLVVSPGAGNEVAWVEAKRLLLSAPALVGNATVAMPITIAMVPIEESTSPTDALRLAEVTLEYARQSATERVVVFSQELQIRAEREYELSSDLASAADHLETIGLSVHYQPVINAFDGRVTAVEGLARWQHPILGTVRPEEFIKVAERAGLVEQIDTFVLKTALADAPTLRAVEPKLGIQVNLSPVGLSPARVRKYSETIVAALGRNSGFTVEIIESAIGDDGLTGILGALGDMRSAGIGVALDDFGIGESNFSRLARLPLTQVKLANVFTTEVSPALAAGVISTIHNMDLECVVEGVETVVQADQMQAAGADAIQGWLFARATPVNQAAEFIRARNSEVVAGSGELLRRNRS